MQIRTSLMLLAAIAFSTQLSADAGYVKKGVKKTDEGVKKGWHETEHGTKKGWEATKDGTKKGVDSTKKFIHKVF